MMFHESTVCHYLYGYKPMRLATVEEINKSIETAIAQTRQNDDIENQSLKLEEDDETRKSVNYSSKIRLADGIALCVSSIPGAKYGACAIQNIPAGTWFGPFEGKLVRTEDDFKGQLSEYMWEIFHDGKVSHFLDGRIQNSWMSFVKCARHKKEQNMVVFQYHGCIYYRTTQEIRACAELLVWYDSKYTQLLGLPLTWNETKNSNGKRKAIGSCTDYNPRKKTCHRKKSVEDKLPVKQSFERNISGIPNLGGNAGNGKYYDRNNLSNGICASEVKYAEIAEKMEMNHQKYRTISDNYIYNTIQDNALYNNHKHIEERMLHQGAFIGRNWLPVHKGNPIPSHIPSCVKYNAKPNHNVHQTCTQTQEKITWDVTCAMPYIHQPYIDSEQRNFQFS